MVLRLAPLLAALSHVPVAARHSHALKGEQRRKRHWVRCVRGVCHAACWSRGGWGRRGVVVLSMPLICVVVSCSRRNCDCAIANLEKTELCLLLLGCVCNVYCTVAVALCKVCMQGEGMDAILRAISRPDARPASV